MDLSESARAQIVTGRHGIGETFRSSGFGLRSASGESGAEGGEERIAERSRSATPAAEPLTEARRKCGVLEVSARDERAIYGVQQASSRGGQGRRAIRGAEQTAR